MARKKQSDTRKGELPSVETAIDRDSLEEAIAQLTPEQTEMFMQALEMSMRKRRLMLVGNLLALVLVLVGTIVAFAVFANREPGSFVAFVFLLPFASAGLCLWVFGKLVKRVSSRPSAADLRPPAETASADQAPESPEKSS